MSTDTPYRGRRRRLSPDARTRILDEVARIDAAAKPPRPPLPPEPPEVLAQIRTILTDGIDPAAEDSADAGAPATPAEAAPTSAPEPEAPAAPEPTPAASQPGPNSALAAPPAYLPKLREIWEDLPQVALNLAALDRNLVITARRRDPAHAAFDVLRTRLVQAMADRNWTRVAVTSPTRGCGKSFTAANLALTLARYGDTRTLLMDMDLRRPALGRVLGIPPTGSIGDFLRGRIAPREALCRIGPNRLAIGPNLAFALNDRVEPYAAELLQEPKTADVLAALQAELAPDIVLFDLPPALAQDDVLAFRPQFDCVLLVVGGGSSRASEVREVVRRIGEDKPIVGIVLNKAEDAPDYAY